MNDNIKIEVKTVGGSPTASHFLLLRQKESNQRKDPGLWLRHNLKVSLRRNKLLRSVLSPLRGSLRCSTGQEAAELALRAQTVLADTP